MEHLPIFKERLSKDADAILQNITNNLEYFTTLLERGALTVNMLSKLETEDIRQRYIQLVLYLRKTDVNKLVAMRLKELSTFRTNREAVSKCVSYFQTKRIFLHREHEIVMKIADNNIMFTQFCAPTDSSNPITISEFRPQINFNFKSEDISIMIRFSECLHSKCFLNQCKQMMEQKRSTVIDFDQVLDICETLYDEFEEFTKNLNTGSISLLDMRDNFIDLYKSDAIRKEFEILDILFPSRFYNDVQEKIDLFFQLIKYQTIAQVIKKLLDIFKVTDEFSAIDSIIESAQNENEFLQRSLGSLDANILECGRQFSKWSESQIDSLKILSECSKLIEWVRDNVESVQQLKVFVDLANISAGENDMDVDRILSFQTAIMAYSALLFDFAHDPTLKTFNNACQSLFLVLKRDPDVPKKLLEATRHMHWIESIKNSHGSVEASSINSVRLINETGRFQIDSPNGNYRQFRLNLVYDPVNDSTSDYQQTMNLEELQELESKLMLISVKEDQQRHVNRFISCLHQIVHILNSLNDLLLQGCNLFSQWSMTGFMDKSKKVSVTIDFGHKSGTISGLNTLEKELDVIKTFLYSCHKSWIECMQRLRFDNPILNYFSTKQLVHLATLFANIKSMSDLDKESESLLRVITPSVDMATLVKTILSCKECDMNTRPIEVQSMETDLVSEENRVNNAPVVMEIDVFDHVNLNKFIENIADSYCLPTYLIRAGIKATSETGSMEKVANWCLENLDFVKDSTVAMEINDEEQDVESENLDMVCDTGSTEIDAEHYQNNFPTCSTSFDMNNIASKENDANFVNESACTASNATDNLSLGVNKLWKDFITSINNIEISDSISFKRLASQLQCIYELFGSFPERKFPPQFTPGVPNLIVCNKKDMYANVLSLYEYDRNKILPSLDEILLCNSTTTQEEIELHCFRAFQDKSGKIFSVLNADVIDFEISCYIEKLTLNWDHKNEYRLVFLSGKENDYHSFISAAFERYRVTMPTLSQKGLISYLRDHMNIKQVDSTDTIMSIDGGDTSTNPDLFRLLLIASSSSGNGKSLLIRRLADTIGNGLKSISLHQQTMDNQKIINTWLSSPKSIKTFHLDVTQAVGEAYEDALFSLSVMQGLSDNYGHIWKCNVDQRYFVEITLPTLITSDSESTLSLFNLLPVVWCVSPRESCDIYENHINAALSKFVTLDDKYIHCLDEQKLRSEEMQRPWQYLALYEEEESLDDFVYKNENAADPVSCLDTLLRHCCIENPTWGELLNFCNFLNVQLMSCENSVFCDPEFVSDMLPNFKNFVVKFLIKMSKDFATRSVNISDESIRVPEVTDRNRWENNPHPYIFFNDGGHTLSLLGFRIIHGALIDELTGDVLEDNFISKDLYEGLTGQGVAFNVRTERMNQKELRDFYIKQLCTVFSVKRYTSSLDKSYELTADNVLKMLAIHMRFRAGIPVIIMGETGTGKTRLIRFICDLQRPTKSRQNLIILKCHGGIEAEHIYSSIFKAIKIAQINISQGVLQTVLFFDEANTTNAIGAIKEAMYDGLVNGEIIPTDIGLKFIAAVNPFRKHSPEMIKKLENAGLGYHLNAESTTDTIRKIPMRRLVYRVKEMPASLISLVWDFGTLNESIERKYISQMVQKYISDWHWPSDVLSLLVNVLSNCQEYMRNQSDECSFVSLRDVERTLTILVWFLSKSEHIIPIFKRRFSRETFPDNFTMCFVWSLGISYLPRLEDRIDFADVILDYFDEPYELSEYGNYNAIIELIEDCQELFIHELDIKNDISRNKALKENVWMMAICTELRIPLFLVGKPGSSKSLAKTVVSDIMQGDNSYSPLFKHFKEIQMISFQCSPLATADGIKGTFRQCQAFQKKQDLERFVSVVVLDEVGLAEDSPKMPLKTLHPLLEDGCLDDEKPDSYKKVAFIGISNWALDPAKMNRGVFVSVGVPSEIDLVDTARGICSYDESSLVTMAPYIESLVRCYLYVYNKQEREYYGLRDFYSLIKMLFKVCRKTNKITEADVVHAIGRCFGGYFGSFHPAEEFVNKMSLDQSSYYLGDPEKSHQLILSSLKENDEGRYVLFLTQNNAALRILQNNVSMTTPNTSIIYGSSFPRDQEYTHLCQNINRIKICMEMGYTVILCNLTNLYESLYDALNQSYVFLGNSRYVDLGLGTHRVKCRVHLDFRLIVVAEDTEVYQKFPVPLINRLEKHFLGMHTMLSAKQLYYVHELKRWIESFASMKESSSESLKFKPQDVFIGYHEDAIASIVLRLSDTVQASMEEIDIIEKAKCMLVQCATPDAINRLINSKLDPVESENIFQLYYTTQHHSSLYDYVSDVSHDYSSCLLQVTTHCRQRTDAVKHQLSSRFDLQCIQLISLHQIDTEEQFRNQMDDFLTKCSSSICKNVLIIQCEADVHKASNSMIECARYCIQDKIKKFQDKKCVIVFLLHLPRVVGGKFIGFPDYPWQNVHIDEIITTSHCFDLKNLQGRCVSSLIDECSSSIFSELVSECLPNAIAKLKLACNRASELLDTISHLLNDNGLFNVLLKRKIIHLLQIDEENNLHSKKWLTRLATKSVYLKEGYTFQQTVWLSLVENVMTQLTCFLNFCDVDKGLNHLKHDVVFFIRVLDAIDLNTWQIHLISTDFAQIGLPDDFSSCVPFSWIYIKFLEQVTSSFGHNISNAHLDSALQSNPLHSVFTEEFVSNESRMTSLLRDILAIKFGYLHLDTNIFCGVADCIQASFQNQSETKSENDITENSAMIDNISATGCFLFIQRLEIRLAFLMELFKFKPEVYQHDRCQEALLHTSFDLDIFSVTAVMDLIENSYKNLSTIEALQTWCRFVLTTIDLLTRHEINIGNDDFSLQENILHLSMLCIFFKLVVTDDTPLTIQGGVIKLLPLLWISLKSNDLKSEKHFNKFLNALTKLSSSTSRLHFTGGVEQCFICLESIKDPVALKCKHVACYNCLARVMKLRIEKSKRNEWNCPALECKQMYKFDYKLQKTSECHDVVESHKRFRDRLNVFFLEILQRFMFDHRKPPEPKVMDILLTFVTTKKLPNRESFTTKQLSPFSGDYLDDKPVIRSFILQLVLKCDWQYARNFLQKMFNRENQLIPHFELSWELCVLVIYAIEDSLLVSDNFDQILNINTKQSAPILCKSKRTLSDNEALDLTTCSSIDKLKFIAESRLDFTVVAQIIYRYTLENHVSEDELEVVNCATQLIMKHDLDQLQKFLVRFIGQNYRIDSISDWKKCEFAPELLPHALHVAQLDYVPDVYLLRGESYLTVRNVLREIFYDTSAIDKIVEYELRQSPNLVMNWQLALVYLTTIDNACKQNLSQFIGILEAKYPKLHALTTQFASDTTVNFQLLTLLQEPAVSALDKSIYFILLHLMQILNLYKDKPPNILMDLLHNIVNNTGNLSNLFLPTMPQDEEFEARTAAQGITRYYFCPNGHAYGIGDCGMPNGSGICPTCREAIGANQVGARQGQLQQFNNAHDTTRQGYILDLMTPNQSNNGLPVRELSALHVALIRFLMHSSMFISALHAPQNVVQIISNGIDAGTLLPVLRQQMRLNVAQITDALGQSEDATIILIHYVIITLSAGHNNNPNQVNLSSKLARQNWEINVRTLLTPIIGNLDRQFQAYQKDLQNDSDAGQNIIWSIIHDNEGLSTFDPDTHVPGASVFWHTRSRITLSNLEEKFDRLVVDDEQRFRDLCPRLHHILHNQRLLSYTTNLVAIISLQTILCKQFAGLFEMSAINKLTIRNFLFEHVKNSQNRDKMRDFALVYINTLIDLFTEIKLFGRYGRAIEHQLQSPKCKIDLTKPPRDRLSYPASLLFPTCYGYGLCAQVVVRLLISAHNAALGDLANQEKPIPVNQVLSQDKVVVFAETELRLLLLANSHYDFPIGQAVVQNIDFEALERGVVDRYLYGRRRIEETESIPNFYFREAVITAKSRHATARVESHSLSTYISQTPLPSLLKHQLLADLASNLPDLCDLLTQLITARDLLKLLPGPPTDPLFDHLKRLRLASPGSTVRRIRFLFINPGPTLQHIDDLILILQVHRTQLLISRGHNPWNGLLAQVFQEDLPDGITSPLRGTSTLLDLLHRIPASVLLPSLHSFIVDRLMDGQLADMDGEDHLMNPEWQLNETIGAVLEDQDNSDLSDIIQEHMSDDILVKHSASLFGHLSSIVDKTGIGIGR